MKLYTFFRSSTSFRARIALNLKGIEYEMEYVSLPGGEHRREAFLRVNPQGLVPALVDGERRLTQSLAIIEYLDETRPEPPFLPKDPGERAYVRALAQMIGCEMHPLNNVRVLNYLTGPLGLDEAAKQQWYEHWIAEGFRPLEQVLASDPRTGRFCYGDAPTLADICLVPQVFNAQRYNCPLDDYPTVMRIYEACLALPAFEAAHPSKQKDAVG